MTGIESKATISHYSDTGLGPAWTLTNGSWSRNIMAIGGGLAATQAEGKEAVIQLSNLHGDVIGTTLDNSSATPALTSEPTAFGVPTSTPSPHAWLGSGGLQTEFSSGVGSGGGSVYIPQLGLHLEPEALSGAASQDPVNEYLADQEQAEPTGTWTGPMVGAVAPPPANTVVTKQFFEEEQWNAPPVNGPVEVDPGILTGKGALERAHEFELEASIIDAQLAASGCLNNVSCESTLEADVQILGEASEELEACYEQVHKGKWIYPGGIPFFQTGVCYEYFTSGHEYGHTILYHFQSEACWSHPIGGTKTWYCKHHGAQQF